MTNAEREELGRECFEVWAASQEVVPRWEQLPEQDRELARRQAEAVARAVLTPVIERWVGLTPLLKSQLSYYLDAPAEGHADA